MERTIDFIDRIECLWTTLLKNCSEALFLMKCKLKSSLFRGLKRIEITVEAKDFFSIKRLITQ